MPPEPRRASYNDAHHLVTLRRVLLEAIDPPRASAASTGWEHEALAWFQRRLAQTDQFAAFVVDGPDGTPVSTAIGVVYDGAPSPWNPTGLHGTVSNVVTHPAHHRHGYASAAFERLLHWFDYDTAVEVIDFDAPTSAITLSRQYGFLTPRDTALRRTHRRNSRNAGEQTWGPTTATT